MKFRVLAVGNRMPAWVEQGVQEYNKRLPSDFNLAWQEIALARRGKSANIAQAAAKEGEQMLAQIKPGEFVIALDVMGKKQDSQSFARRLDVLRTEGQDIVLLIGGPDGLSENILTRANERWSLSDLTLPHPLIRVMLAEQFYRAWSLLNNHPYHRA